jgi:hypothetical protein
VCHNLATWRCIFAAQLKIYEYEKGFTGKKCSEIIASTAD